MKTFQDDLYFIKKVTVIQFVLYGIFFIGCGMFYGHANGGWWRAGLTAAIIFAILSVVMYLTYERV